MPGDVADVDIIYLNWLSVDYHRRYITNNDYLEFRPQGSGTHRFQVESFTQEDVFAYDITDVANPKRIINPKIERVGAKYRVSFQDERSSAKTYLALTSAQKRKPVKIVKNIPSNLRSMENGSDYIIITHKVSSYQKSILNRCKVSEYRRRTFSVYRRITFCKFTG